MSIIISRLESNVWRIRSGERTRPSYLERYGLIAALPEGKEVQSIPGIEFECLWDSWAEERRAFEKQFFDTNRKQIIGRPDDGEQDMLPVAAGKPLEGAFAIRFPIKEDESFFGLGEASKDRVCLNGQAYQNFAKYQADEIPVPLIMSSGGWGLLVLAETKHYVDVNSCAAGYLSLIGYEDLDVLVFAPASMAEILKQYARFTGRSMVLPRWAYGLTYIAPIFATQFDVLHDAEKMQELGIPCSHFSLEPGWMTKFYDMSTQKEWCLERYHMPQWLLDKPYPDTFVSALRRMGIHLSLWICVDYDLTDEAEREAGLRSENAYEPWYRHMGELVKTGVDGFKLDPANMLDPYLLTMGQSINPYGDCANGEYYERMHNLNQLLLPKQVYEGFVRQTGRRPMLHYCGGYMGVQKWCAQTTGDNGGELGAMIWLMTLAMSGVSNTTVDMDIFTPESQHFAFFAPWAHLNAWEGVRQPWYAGKEMKDMFIRYAQLRGRLLPYIYSAALEAHLTGMPMIRPLTLAFGGFEAVSRQYMFGPWLMVGCYTQELQLPEGRWFDAWTGEWMEGGQTVAYERPEKWGGPLLIHEGAIIPQEDGEGTVIHLFPLKSGESQYVLYEDDGETAAYSDGAIAGTRICMNASEEEVTLLVSTAEGSYAGMAEDRLWRIRLHDQRRLIVRLENKNDRWVQESHTGFAHL